MFIIHHSPIHLYRFIEDTWSGGLHAWCAHPDPANSWLLAENPGQTRWLLRKLAQSNLPPVRIFTADTLRVELARLAGLTPLPPNPATAALLVKTAAQDPAAARNAPALAEACDTLARAGWHLNQLPVDPTIARRLHRVFDRDPILPGIFDRRLREALPPQPIRLCCIGWDATRWPDLNFLDLAASKAASFEIYVPSPRLPADSQQREWIEALEQRLKLDRVTCPESGFTSDNEPLVARLENSQLADRAEAHSPILLVGREWPDQVRLVCDQVAAWLTETPVPADPIGIIAPEDSPTALAVAESLEKAGIPIERLPRRRESAPALLILEQIARYHLSGHDIADLLELTHLLHLHAGESWSALEPEPAQDALDRAFQSAQSRNSRILAQSLPQRKDPTWTTLCNLVEILDRWDTSPAPSSTLNKNWDAMLSALRLPGSANLRGGGGEQWGLEAGRAPIGIVPQFPSNFPPETPVPPRAFIEHLSDSLTAQRRNSPSPNYSPSTPVVLTTFRDAAQQPWHRLILLDSNEHIWPAPILENPFLPDTLRTRLNRNRGESPLLLTTRDLRALDQSRFLDLLEHCHHPIAFAGLLLDQTDSGTQAQPNDWVLRTLLETAPPNTYPPALWSAAAQSSTASTKSTLPPAERAHLAQVHASRQNPTTPFDRYQFNFNETKLEPAAWSATALDEAITAPATFALRELFNAQSTAGWSPTRAEGAAVGNRTHRWLGRILGLSDNLAPLASATGDESKLTREFAAARREIDEWYAAENLPTPLWWITCLRKTEWATRRCLREVRSCLGTDAPYCAMEQKLAVTVQTPAGPMLVKGRIDILISDRPEFPGARLRMFDFKTGRGQAPTLASLERGSGAQFAAYCLMARDAGAAEATIGIIKPDERPREVFTPADEPALRAHFALLANLWRTLRFPRRGPLVSDYGICETLPLATFPIDPAILEQKASLFLLA